MGYSCRSLHPRDIQKKIQRNMHRRHNNAMGATERKRYAVVHKKRMQAHGIRRKRKAHRKRMAHTRQGDGVYREFIIASGSNYCKRLRTFSSNQMTNAELVQALAWREKVEYNSTIQTNQQNQEAMKQETKNKWSVIINIILTTITAILSAFGLA